MSKPRQRAPGALAKREAESKVRRREAESKVRRRDGATREHVVRETFKLCVDVLLDVADERPLDELETRVLEVLSPDLAAAVREYKYSTTN